MIEIIFAAVAVLIFAAAALICWLWIGSRKADAQEWDVCDTCASEPMPMEKERRKVRAGDVA